MRPFVGPPSGPRRSYLLILVTMAGSWLNPSCKRWRNVDVVQKARTETGTALVTVTGVYVDAGMVDCDEREAGGWRWETQEIVTKYGTLMSRFHCVGISPYWLA